MSLTADDLALRQQLDASTDGQPRPLIPITGPGLLIAGGGSVGLLLIGAVIGVVVDDSSALLTGTAIVLAFIAGLAVVVGLAVRLDQRTANRAAACLAQGDSTEVTLEAIAGELVTIHRGIAILQGRLAPQTSSRRHRRRRPRAVDARDESWMDDMSEVWRLAQDDARGREDPPK